MIFQSILQRLGKVKITIGKNIAKNNVFVDYKFYFFHYPEILSINILKNSLDTQETKENYFSVFFLIYEIKNRCVTPFLKSNTIIISNITKKFTSFLMYELFSFLFLKMDSKWGEYN